MRPAGRVFDTPDLEVPEYSGIFISNPEYPIPE